MNEGKTVIRLGDGELLCEDCYREMYPERDSPLFGWIAGKCDICGVGETN